MLGWMLMLADSLSIDWWACGIKVLFAAVLACFVTTIASIHSPRVKMLVFSMPIPFTCAYLVNNHPVDSSNMSGIVLVTLYHWIVFWMVVKRGLPLALAIGASVTCYIGTAILIKSWIVTVPLVLSTVMVTLMWAAGSWSYKPIHEEGHRGKSPWYLKLPVVFAIALVIYSLTGLLGGAVTTFPYAGVFTSYEMRRNLRTLAGQYMVNNLSFIAMFVAIAVAEHSGANRFVALLAGWIVVIVLIWGIYALGWGKPKTQGQPKLQGA